jgi:hypothetical protein
MQRFLFLFFIILSVSCARIGAPTGGEKDTIPPKIIRSIPENKTTNFKGKEIKIYFDEFIQLKNTTNNILITPPQKKQPEISPLGTASKEIRIKFKDSLLPNTTYVINFGESIEDFNEGNKMGNYQFVFSTGDQIDSLKLKGKVFPLYFKKYPENIIVGLYPVNKFHDSIVYREPPYYISKTDKNGNFSFDFIKNGKYKIIAIADEVNNYLYNPNKEAIAFLKRNIEIPKDSLVNLYLFKEKKPFTLEKWEQLSHNHIQAKYEGNIDSIQIKFLSPIQDSLFLIDNNQANIWYKSLSDSIKIELINKKYKKILQGKRKANKDSLIIKVIAKTALHPLDSIIIKGNIPLTEAQKNQIKLIADSIPISFKLLEQSGQKWLVEFEKKTGKKYFLQINPGSFTSFMGDKNKDTITKKFSIAPKDQYGKLILQITGNITSPFFIELLDNKRNIIRKSPTTTASSIPFKLLKPGKYYIRIIIDKNQNNQWDTGNFLKHILPEKVIEIQKPIEIRANWEINQEIKL